MIVKDKKGFTLIEVISVLVILGLLATIIVTQYSLVIRESRKSLNEEQKSRLVEVAKNISLNNKSCLEIAKNSADEGVKITLDQMKNNGYIANNQLKNLEDSTALNSCVIIKWDENYNKFEYEYSESCDSARTCMVTAESEKVIVSSFYVGEANTNYTNKRNVDYYVHYSSSINAEYCITLENEASCSWKKLSTNSTTLGGNLNLNNVENIAHLYIRNSNKNIIASIDDSIIFDTASPVCSWGAPTKSYINNGSSTEIVLSCSDVAGIRNVELLASAININGENLVTLSDAIVTNKGTGKDFKFVVQGLTGNGNVTLSLKSGVISDTSGNLVNTEYSSGRIYVDNIKPEEFIITVGDSNNRYTNSDTVTLNFSNVSSDVRSMCISNSSVGNCEYTTFASTVANWHLTGDSGEKTIYVTLIDEAGNTRSSSVQIIQDTMPPTCQVSTGSSVSNFYLKNGSYIDYVITCSDNSGHIANNVSFSTSNFIVNNIGDNNVSLSVFNHTSTGATLRVQALNGNGKTIVYLAANSVYDLAGNGNILDLDNDKAIARVTIDNLPPYDNGVLINYGATKTHLDSLTITLRSSVREDNGFYCLTDNPSTCDEWNSYPINSVAAFNIRKVKGEHTVYAFYKDRAGNMSMEAASDSIYYDSEALYCSLTLDNGSILIRPSNVNNLASEPYSTDGNAWTSENRLALIDGQKSYFTYIKDLNGDTNYCETVLSN